MLPFAIQQHSRRARLPVILACALCLAGCGLAAPEPALPPAASFLFTVRVQAPDSELGLAGARVMLFLPGQPPRDELTDSDGYATFQVGTDSAGQTANLEVEAAGYAKYTKQIQLVKDSLPYAIRLAPLLTPQPPATHTTVPALTPAPTPEPTPSPTPTPTPLPPAARITSHADGARVPRFIELMGDYTASLTDDLWVFVQPGKGHYYPQSPNAGLGLGTLKKDGRWEVRAGLGLDEDVNLNFDIILASADAATSRFISTTLMKWHEENFYPGFVEMLPGLQEMDRITVRRTAGIYEDAPDVSNAILPGQASISPFPDDQVSASTTITGTYTPISMTGDLWVLVYTYFGRWYPQSQDACVGAHTLRDSSGQWWVRGTFGDDRDAGKPFDIVVVYASPNASRFLDVNQRAWCIDQTYPGYLTIELPQGLMEKARYRVYRR